MIRACCVVLAVALQVFAADVEFKVVPTDLGRVRGQVQQTLLDKRDFYSFRGIRYGQAPVKELRFKPPRSPEPRTDVQDALSYGNICAQLTLVKETYVGDEDCLFLNVYTPSVAPEKPLPVIVAIHGGAFETMSSDWLGPDLLLDHDVVLVTFNYRLGPLGFLSLANEKYPGNYGMKDQRLALQWVNRNIHNFGGDPKKITLYGYSAGATSVHLHLLSPESKGLFQRANLASGSALAPWAFNDKGENRDALQRFAKKQAGDDAEWTDEKLDELLRDVDTETLIKGTLQPFYVGGANKKALLIEWSPVVEVPGAEEPFLLETPQKAIANLTTDVDTLIGFNNAEAMLVPVIIEFRDPKLLAPFAKDFLLQFPLRHVQLPYESEEYKALAKSVRSFYFEKEIDQSIPEFINLLSDIGFTYSSHIAAKELCRASSGKTYYYIFSIEGNLNFFRRFASAAALNLSGAAHADDLGYIFKLNSTEIVPSDGYESLDDTDKAQIRQLTQIFADFALHGNPAPNDKPVEWKPMQKDAINYVELKNNEVTAAVDPIATRFAFWDDFYKNH